MVNIMKRKSFLFKIGLIALIVSISCYRIGYSQTHKVDYSALVNVTADVRYAEKPDSVNNDLSSDRLLDIYLPKDNKGGKLPVYVYIHGGGFSGGDKSQH